MKRFVARYWCVLFLFFTGIIFTPHTPPLVPHPYHAQAVLIVPHVHPTAIFYGTPTRKDYSANDIFQFFLSNGLLVIQDYPSSITFGNVLPQSIITFKEYTTTGTYHHTLAVYQSDEDAHLGYIYLKSATKDTLFWHNRCVLIEDASSPISKYIQRGCFN